MRYKVPANLRTLLLKSTVRSREPPASSFWLLPQSMPQRPHTLCSGRRGSSCLLRARPGLPWDLACWCLWGVGPQHQPGPVLVGPGGSPTTRATGNRSEDQSQAGGMEAAVGRGSPSPLREPGTRVVIQCGWPGLKTPFSDKGPRFCRGALQPQGAGSVGAGSAAPLPVAPAPPMVSSAHVPLVLALACAWASGPCLPPPAPLRPPCFGRTS